jgi:DNA-binding NarL/FixJ family response regulator
MDRSLSVGSNSERLSPSAHRHANCNADCMIKIILADHQRIFRIGMASALAVEDDIRIVGQPRSVEHLLNALKRFRAQVLVLSSAYLGRFAEIKQACSDQRTSILLLEESEDLTLSQFSADVHGVIQRSADQAALVRCIRHLARGGSVSRFVPNQPVEYREDSVGFRVRQRLSPLDFRIIGLVVQGYRNREIALRLGRTEQGIKNSLRRIFDKTGVSDRLELALFVLHHRVVDRVAADAVPAQTLSSVAAMQLPRDLNFRRPVN